MINKTEKTVQEIKAASRTRRSSASTVIEGQNRPLYFNSGSVLLNLACSDKAFGGFGIGKMTNLIGDSSTGKTLLALSMFAEMAQTRAFDQYDFIYDDVEAALSFDLTKLFGKKVAEKIQAPKNDTQPQSSNTIQDFHAEIFQKLQELKSPFLWILDSFDALTADEEINRVEQSIIAREKGKEIKGSYRMEKPKLVGEILRQIVRKLKDTESGLVIISQTRDNIDPMSFEKKTRSGGRALLFYACHEVWLAVKNKIESKKKIIGAQVKAKVTKNKLTGKMRTVEFPIYYDYGVDNIGSCIDFLVQEEHWEERKQTVIANTLELEGTRSKLIKEIEEKNLETALFLETEKVWLAIEENLKLNRKPKYL